MRISGTWTTTGRHNVNKLRFSHVLSLFSVEPPHIIFRFSTYFLILALSLSQHVAVMRVRVLAKLPNIALQHSIHSASSSTYRIYVKIMAKRFQSASATTYLWV